MFYLTGFCGLNLLKHSCFTCHQDDFHLIYDLDKSDAACVCEAHSHSHAINFDEEFSYTHYKTTPCCSLELIYLKNEPKTLIKQVVKSPLLSSIDLLLFIDLQFQNSSDSSRELVADRLQKIIEPPSIAQDFLCCYRC